MSDRTVTLLIGGVILTIALLLAVLGSRQEPPPVPAPGWDEIETCMDRCTGRVTA